MRNKKTKNTGATFKSILTLVLLALSVVVAPSQAQNKSKSGAKVYCWQEEGSTKCGNIPPAQQAREINTKTGLSKNTPVLPETPPDTLVEKPLAPQQLAPQQLGSLEVAQPSEEGKTISPLVQSLVANYPTEERLVHYFKEKTDALEKQISILMGEEKTQHKNLLKMLEKAGDDELNDKKINEKDLEAILKLRKNVVKLQQDAEKVMEDKKTLEEGQKTLLLEYREAIAPNE